LLAHLLMYSVSPLVVDIVHRPSLKHPITSYVGVLASQQYAEMYGEIYFRLVTGHLSKGLFVRNGVVQIPKFDAKPNPTPDPNPMPIRFGQMTLRTSE